MTPELHTEPHTELHTAELHAAYQQRTRAELEEQLKTVREIGEKVKAFRDQAPTSTADAIAFELAHVTGRLEGALLVAIQERAGAREQLVQAHPIPGVRDA